MPLFGRRKKDSSEEASERAKEIRGVFEALAEEYKGHCSFRYRQADELRKVGDKSQGVCFGMSLDWLRRKLLNSNMAAESTSARTTAAAAAAASGGPATDPADEVKRKRDFDDEKYGQDKARQRLTKKHVKLHSAYKKSVGAKTFRQPTSVHISVMAKAGVFHALDRLTIERLDYDVPGYEFAKDDSDAEKKKRFKNNLHDVFQQAIEKMGGDPGCGVLFHMKAYLDDGGGGHETALFITSQEIRFFDANMGEYFFGAVEQDTAEDFVSSLWLQIYHRYAKFNGLEFEFVRCARPAERE